ncbi:MAG: ABC transporter ATP-binding protein, partial [Lachnospiraceae bacterium]|nr:ABC transporter ATP-binding protein [Lachnospiraceae bacterium]
PIDPRINRALKISHSDFVFDLDSGINANVAQGGTNFSGGQKQRLAIARAVYKDAKIYIFDDSFSALDYKTDMLVRRDIRENMKNSLVIIVAQRIGTIRNADRILVLDEGRIVGSGRHDELLKNCDVYRDIALSQLSEEEL